MNTPRLVECQTLRPAGIEIALQPLDVLILQRVGAKPDARKLAWRD
jgi:hypothetical protein